ncbi:MAG: hypothetical protein PF448_08910 [Bacteroidales bacterium]|nr:hypothetical protein [Bacteroidales bacterium]
MKKLYLLCGILLITTFAIAQDWMPFIVNQHACFSQETEDNQKVELFILDSVDVNAQASVFYFNAKSVIDSCHGSFTPVIEWNNPYNEARKPERMILRNDSLIFPDFTWNTPDSVVFLPFAEKGDSWTTNEISITCDTIFEMSFLGLTDSVKQFTCNSGALAGQQFLLSKSYGFVAFVPFKNFFAGVNDEVYNLIGLQDDAMDLGFHQPDFSEYFTLNEGDMLFWFWESDFYDISQPDLTERYVDSIKTVYRDSDSVAYLMYRRTFRQGELIYENENYLEIFTRAEYEVFIGNPTSYFGLIPDDFGYEFFVKTAIEIEPGLEDTIHQFEYIREGFLLLDDCSIGNISDYYSRVQLSTTYGVEKRINSDTGVVNTLQIDGSIISGEHWGNTDIPNHLSDLNSEDFSVFPNPCTDKLYVKSPKNKEFDLRLYCLNGLLIKHCTNCSVFDLQSISRGLYVLEVARDNEILFRKSVVLTD